MDPRRFDSLTRALAAAKTRRGLVGARRPRRGPLWRPRGRRPSHAGAVRQPGLRRQPGVCTNGCVCCVV